MPTTLSCLIFLTWNRVIRLNLICGPFGPVQQSLEYQCHVTAHTVEEFHCLIRALDKYRITETANQLLNRIIPICTWQVPGSTNTTEPAYPRFQYVMREWRDFNQSVILNRRRTVPCFQLIRLDACGN
ncbi:unnamed protein product [Rhizophagus irregularis]|nr:unnamed protein product [Rhizophagus irregularis]